MAKITIPPVSGGFDLKTTVDARLQQVEDELNTKVLYKTNPVGEDNSLDNDIDMDGYDLLNTGTVNADNVLVSGIDYLETLTALAEEAQAAAISASESATAGGSTLLVMNYQSIRDYAGAEQTFYARGQITAGDSGEAFFQKKTGAAPGFYVDNGVDILLPSGGNGSEGWVRRSVPVESYLTVAEAIADTKKAVLGGRFNVEDYATGRDAGVMFFKWVPAATGTADGGSYIDHDTLSLQAKQNFNADTANIQQFGALVDGSADDSVQINSALAAVDHVLVPTGKVAMCKNILAPDYKTLEVRGTLKLPDNVSDQDAIVKDTAVTGFTLKGHGTLDGNRANQSGVISTEAVRISPSTGVTLQGLEITSFYGHESAAEVTHCVHLSTGTKNMVDNIRLVDWSQEGILLEDVQYSTVSNISAVDNAGTSWSAVQISGDDNKYNVINNITTFNTGGYSCRIG